MLVGLCFWNRLPEEIATHFDSEGVPNGYSSRAFAVIGLPLFMLAMHALCLFVTLFDPKRRNISGKLFSMMVWLCPAISWLSGGAILSYALGLRLNFARVMPVLMGLLFVFIGNYLPKCRQNYTVGIKLPWTLDNEDNWNHTHRFAGWVWTAGGLIVAALGLLGMRMKFVFPALILVMSVCPAVYSFLYAQRHREN